MKKGEIYEIICECGLRFSSEEYYNNHLEDVGNAKFLLRHKHSKKQIKRMS